MVDFSVAKRVVSAAALALALPTGAALAQDDPAESEAAATPQTEAPMPAEPAAGDARIDELGREVGPKALVFPECEHLAGANPDEFTACLNQLMADAAREGIGAAELVQR